MSTLTTEGREGLLGIHFASVSRKGGPEAVKKELEFRPGGEVIICFKWIYLLAPGLACPGAEWTWR